jgi:hypothetical protein
MAGSTVAVLRASAIQILPTWEQQKRRLLILFNNVPHGYAGLTGMSDTAIY